MLKKFAWIPFVVILAGCGGAFSGATIGGGTTPSHRSPADVPKQAAGVTTFDVIPCAAAAHGDHCDQPIAGVVVKVHTAINPDVYDTKTSNADGYTLFAEPDTLINSDITFEKDGYLPQTVGVLVADLVGHHNIFPLYPVVPPQPPLDKRDFIEHYQGNFGSIKVEGCDFFNDALFDPVVLLGTWTRDKPCFEKAMGAHSARNDNRVVVDPRSDYGGRQHGAAIDLWHDPLTFAAFVRDVRSHRNALGEPFKVLLFLSGDGHIDSFLAGGQEGVPNPAEEAHFEADVKALAAATRDLVDGTVTCWECRHVRNYITPGGYERIGRIVAREFPKAWHGQHLISGSSSWSSWNCDPDAPDAPTQKPPCTLANSHKEGDDPNRGQEQRAWDRCTSEGWCDGLLYQFSVGDEYLNPDAYPNYAGHPGALGRYWEITARMGNDATSKATRGSAPHWPSVDVIAFENIYDAYNDRSTEAYGIAFCRRALAIGGWGCGSASVRR